MTVTWLSLEQWVREILPNISNSFSYLFTSTTDQVHIMMDYEEGSFQEYSTHSDAIFHLLFSPALTTLPQLVSASQHYLHIWTVYM